MVFYIHQYVIQLAIMMHLKFLWFFSEISSILVDNEDTINVLSIPLFEDSTARWCCCVIDWKWCHLCIVCLQDKNRKQKQIFNILCHLVSMNERCHLFTFLFSIMIFLQKRAELEKWRGKNQLIFFNVSTYAFVVFFQCLGGFKCHFWYVTIYHNFWQKH